MLATALIIGVLAVWFGLSLLNQFGRGALIRPIKRRDAFSLIPIWTFFAPRPGVTDFNVLYRDRSRDGACGPWREMQPHRSRWFKGIWNPDKRVRKGTTDMCNSLMRIAVRKPGKRMFVQLPYLTLLHYVCEAPQTSVSHMRQFAIVRTFGFHTDEEPQVVFVSALHRLDRETAPEVRELLEESA